MYAIEPKEISNLAKGAQALWDADPAELRLIADALPVLIAQVDGEERFRFNNRAYEGWFGMPVEGFLGRLVREVFGEASYAQFCPHIRKAMEGEREFFEAVLPHPQLGERNVQAHCIPSGGGPGRARRLYLLISDATEERKLADEKIRSLNADLERRVQERTAQLVAINKELEAFCYSVSHDLRAPLRTIRGFGDVLLEQYLSQLDSRGQDFLRRTCEASAQMDRLIEDLLKLSRVARSELRAEGVNLSEIAEDIVETLRKAEPERVVDVRIVPGLEAHGDGRLLRLVLDNLLRNAWKFTSRTPNARIEFNCKPGPDGAFFVADNGAGFDMRYADKLFGVFQRLHSTGEYPGSGVGLAIVKRIINRHGGRTWATGEVGRGATFYFTLPEVNPW